MFPEERSLAEVASSADLSQEMAVRTENASFEDAAVAVAVAVAVAGDSACYSSPN